MQLLSPVESDRQLLSIKRGPITKRIFRALSCGAIRAHQSCKSEQCGRRRAVAKVFVGRVVLEFHQQLSQQLVCAFPNRPESKWWSRQYAFRHDQPCLKHRPNRANRETDSNSRLKPGSLRPCAAGTQHTATRWREAMPFDAAAQVTGAARGHANSLGQLSV